MENGQYAAFLARQAANGWHLAVVHTTFVAWTYVVPEGYAKRPLLERMACVNVGQAEMHFDINGRAFTLAFTLPRPDANGRAAIELERAEATGWAYRSNDLVCGMPLRLAASTNEALAAAARYAERQAAEADPRPLAGLVERGATYLIDETADRLQPDLLPADLPYQPAPRA